MVIAVFYPYVGGAEKQAQRLALELLKENMEVTVITGRWDNRLKKCESIKNLMIIRNLTNFKFWGKGNIKIETDLFRPYLSADNKRLGYIKILFSKIFIRISIYIYQISLFLFLLAYRKNYDVIHVHQVLFPAFISSLCARILKKPIIVKVGSSGFNSDINQIKKYTEGRFQLKYILKNIGRLICTTRKMVEEFTGEGMNKDKIILLHNGVEISNFNRNFSHCRNLVYLGRFTRTKNIETLILAFLRIIRTADQNLKLILIGDGPERGDIVNLIEKSNLGKNIILTGLVEDPSPFLKKSDLFVFPSLMEGLSNSLIEAMSYKLPCIVTNVPGNAEVIGGNYPDYNIKRGNFIVTEYGILFNPADVEGLVNSIIFLLKDSNTRKKLGESAYRRVRAEYDIEVIAKKYKKLYEEVLKY